MWPCSSAAQGIWSGRSPAAQAAHTLSGKPSRAHAACASATGVAHELHAKHNPTTATFIWLWHHRYDLGKGEWSNPDGCGQGEGELHMRVTYTPFDKMARHPSDSVTVRTNLQRA